MQSLESIPDEETEMRSSNRGSACRLIRIRSLEKLDKVQDSVDPSKLRSKKGRCTLPVGVGGPVPRAHNGHGTSRSYLEKT